MFFFSTHSKLYKRRKINFRQKDYIIAFYLIIKAHEIMLILMHLKRILFHTFPN